MKPSPHRVALVGLLALGCSLPSPAQIKVIVANSSIGSAPGHSLALVDTLPQKTLPLWMRGGRSGPVREAIFIDHGRLIVTRAEDITTYVESVIRVHEFSSGKLIQTLRFVGSSCAVSHDGRLLASEESHVDYTHDLHIWNLEQGKELLKFAAPGAVYRIVFSTDDKTIVACGRHGFVGTWDVATGRKSRSYQGFTEDVQQIFFTPGDRFLIARGGESKASEIRIWDSKTCALISTISTNYLDPLPLAISPDGDTSRLLKHQA